VAPVRAAGTAAAVVVLAVLAVSTATVVARHGGGTSLGPVPAAPSTGPEDGPPELAIAAAPGQPSWRPVASGELSADWQDWSWDAVVTRGRSGPDGAAAIRVDLTDGYAGFSLRRDEPVRPGPGATARVRLWVEGEGTVLGLAVQSTDDRPGRRGTDVEVPGRHWVVLDLPVGPAPVRRVTVERRGSGAAAGTVRIWVAAVLVS
jgi:hypothetical protein